MKNNYTHVSILIDRSGSMASIRKSVMSGLEEFINDQKTLDGDCTLSIVAFNHTKEYISSFVDLKTYEFDPNQYQPSGTTALVDSMYEFIKETGQHLAKMSEDERPSKVVFLVITDGEENASKQFTNEQLKELVIEHTDIWKWNFTYIGANQDSFAVSKTLGISTSSTINYNTTINGVSNIFTLTSGKLKGYRSGNSKTLSYTSDEQEYSEKLK